MDNASESRMEVGEWDMYTVIAEKQTNKTHMSETIGNMVNQNSHTDWLMFWWYVTLRCTVLTDSLSSIYWLIDGDSYTIQGAWVSMKETSAMETFQTFLTWPHLDIRELLLELT